MNKLVRDLIPEIIKKSGKEPNVYIAEDKEYWLLLKQKLSEEVQEFLESESIEEMADILEVMDAICSYKNLSKTELEAVKRKKFDERGGFCQKRVLCQYVALEAKS